MRDDVLSNVAAGGVAPGEAMLSEAVLGEVAARQDGVLTRQQALAAG